MEFPLNTLIECLNIFGTAVGSSSTGFGGSHANRQKWRKNADESDDDEREVDNDAGARRSRRSRRSAGVNGQIDHYFSGSDGKGTGMRMLYAGAGHPLTLLL